MSWLDFKDSDVLIQTSTGDLLFNVKKIDVFSSISGAINIGLTLSSDKHFDKIKIGDKVFKILNKC